ncbi:GGDEF domain-containing protein [Alicycliphilus denitrificans]|uniref:GGDEF domain-containing protein n=1 Tax=Alicycliphilus denitrificans TaxID=179636 RepID=UPI003A800BF5
MLSFDLPTMLLMTVASSVTMAVAIVAVRHNARKDGLGLWSIALLLHACAYVLLALRGRVPDMVSVVLANIVLSGVFALMLAAVLQFQGRVPRWWQTAVPVAATAVLFTVFVEHYVARLVIAGMLFSAQLGLSLWALWRPPQPTPGRGARLIMVGVTLQAVSLMARAALAVGGQMPTAGLLEASPIQFLTFFATFVVVILSSLGMIFMVKDRADADNRYFATHDELTGVANRRALIQALDRDVAHAVRSGEPYALLMLDVDHFKSVNDGHGHRAGDQVLCHVAAILRARLRAQDLVGRYGGEEFVVLLPGTPARGAAGLAETLREAVEQTPCEYGGRAIPVTVSIGVCGARLEGGDTWDRLIHAADQALYAAKAAGRNRVECVALAQEPPRAPAAPA